MVQPFDRGEGGLQTIPLRLIFIAAGSDGNGVTKCCVVGPKLEFCKGWATGEKIEDGTNNGLLLVGERDAGSGIDVCVFDIEG